LNGISDWSTQHPFIDLMKSARPWVGHLPNQWGGISFEELVRSGVLNENGWPTSVPAATTRLEALILTDQPQDALHLAGRYHVFFDGSGKLEVAGLGHVQQREPGKLVFTYQPGEGSVGISISETDANDPIRNIRVVKEEHLELFKRGVLFNPAWIRRIGQVNSVRFMDWMNTNNSSVVHWSDMPNNRDFSYTWRGVPLGVMIALANEIDANPWFTLPHQADDAAVQRFAETVLDTLEPERIAYVEYSNEVWNHLFEQAHWAGRQAEARWGDVNGGWMQLYGLRAAQVMAIWTEVFGGAADGRLERVVAVQTGWPGLETFVLYGERVREDLGFDPIDVFDAYAVTGYFGGELGEPELVAKLLNEAEALAVQAGSSKASSRDTLHDYVSQNELRAVNQAAADMVRNGSLRELTEALWPYHAEVAHDAKLDLIMYEGGTHATPNWESVEDERLVTFLIEFNYSNEIAALYREALTSWSRISGNPFNAFVDVAPPSQWGSWGALRHLDDTNPRWDALRAGIGSSMEE
jgi:hypothetical protein